MSISFILGVLTIWSVLGFIILGIAWVFIDFIDFANGFAWLSPMYIYKEVKVNWFGCFCITLLVNMLCPIASICYWFYRLCKVGRK